MRVEPTCFHLETAYNCYRPVSNVRHGSEAINAWPASNKVQLPQPFGLGSPLAALGRVVQAGTMKLAICCPSTGGETPAVESWIATMSKHWSISINATTQGEGAGYLHKVQEYYKRAKSPQWSPLPDILAYFHSDCSSTKRTGTFRVLKEFEDSNVALVVFFGAKELGRSNIYVDPYDFRQLARGGCYSNMRDWFNHGQRLHWSNDRGHDRQLFAHRAPIVSGRDRRMARSERVPKLHGSAMWLCMMAARHRRKCDWSGLTARTPVAEFVGMVVRTTRRGLLRPSGDRTLRCTSGGTSICIRSSRNGFAD